MEVNRQMAGPLWMMTLAGGALLLFGLSLWLLRLSDATGLVTLPTVQGQSFWVLFNLVLAGGALSTQTLSLAAPQRRVFLFCRLALLLSASLALVVHFALPSVLTQLSPPSINATLAFAAGAVALLLPQRAVMIVLLAFCVALLAILGYVGLIFGFDPVFGWSQEMHMSGYTVMALMLFATGLFAFGWQRVNAGMGDPVRGVSLLIGSIILLATIAACFLVYAAAAMHLHHLAEAGSAIPGLAHTHDANAMYLQLHQELWKVLPFGALILVAAAALVLWRLLPVARALRASEQLHRTVVDVLAEGVLVQDTDGRIISANEAAAHILDRSMDDIIGRHSRDESWDVIHEDGSPFSGDDHPSMATLRRGEPQLAVIMGVKRSDGARVWISVNSRALWDSAGRGMTGVVSSFQDITERHETEQQVIESRARLRALTEHLQEVREQEKAHIAREIHDELGGTLTALKMDAVWLSRRLSDGAGPIHNKLEGFSAMVDGAINITRRIMSELRPTVLDDLGLWAAIEWQAREFEQRSGIGCTLDMMCDEVVLDERQSITVFRVVQEALTNISRHARAEHVSIECRCQYDTLVLRVVDDGVGFEESTATRLDSHGIRGMYERIGQIDGKLAITSRPGNGCTVEIRLPWSQAKE